MTQLTTSLFDKETNKVYNRSTLTFKTIEEATKYIIDLQDRFSMTFTYVRYTLTVK